MGDFINLMEKAAMLNVLSNMGIFVCLLVIIFMLKNKRKY